VSDIKYSRPIPGQGGIMKKKKRAGINCLVPFLFAVYMVLLIQAAAINP
jgi:hypothetical protein